MTSEQELTAEQKRQISDEAEQLCEEIAKLFHGKHMVSIASALVGLIFGTPELAREFMLAQMFRLQLVSEDRAARAALGRPKGQA
jgi:hypothetical protein